MATVIERKHTGVRGVWVVSSDDAACTVDIEPADYAVVSLNVSLSGAATVDILGKLTQDPSEPFRRVVFGPITTSGVHSVPVSLTALRLAVTGADAPVVVYVSGTGLLSRGAR